jgi:hypothetical protein
MREAGSQGTNLTPTVATKREVFAELDKIRSTVEEMEHFAQFPEGRAAQSSMLC